jgi:hypothetical protein
LGGSSGAWVHHGVHCHCVHCLLHASQLIAD